MHLIHLHRLIPNLLLAPAVHPDLLYFTSFSDHKASANPSPQSVTSGPKHSPLGASAAVNAFAALASSAYGWSSSAAAAPTRASATGQWHRPPASYWQSRRSLSLVYCILSPSEALEFQWQPSEPQNIYKATGVRSSEVS